MGDAFRLFEGLIDEYRLPELSDKPACVYAQASHLSNPARLDYRYHAGLDPLKV